MLLRISKAYVCEMHSTQPCEDWWSSNVLYTRPSNLGTPLNLARTGDQAMHFTHDLPSWELHWTLWGLVIKQCTLHTTFQAGNSTQPWGCGGRKNIARHKDLVWPAQGVKVFSHQGLLHCALANTRCSFSGSRWTFACKTAYCTVPPVYPTSCTFAFTRTGSMHFLYTYMCTHLAQNARKKLDTAGKGKKDSSGQHRSATRHHR